MPPNSAQIILRADIVQPSFFPPVVVTTFDRILNQFLPGLGFSTAVEFFEAGCVLFFATLDDFRTVFGEPLFLTDDQSKRHPNVGDEACDAPIIWDYVFHQLPVQIPEEKLAKIMKKYYARYRYLRVGSIEEIPGEDAPTRYRVTHPCIEAYMRSAENYMVSAHEVFKTKRHRDSKQEE